MSLENLFDLLGGRFRMPAHFGWGVGSVVAEPVAGVGKRVAGRAYKEKSHFGMRMMTNFQYIFGHVP